MHKIEERKGWIGLLAKAPADRLTALWDKVTDRPGFTFLRAPEIGGAMVRGRMGGTGGAFNLGEMTVTRCSVQIDSGEVGHAYVQGRDKAKAEAAALIDALMQTKAADGIREAVLVPLELEMTSSKVARAAKAAATKVDFFTMVRGED
ncbi:Alpha-D-ribose 1-methylphosphonate 5-triphosphate synthase subunit PhnG [Thalassovita gelatinovora]|uniref:Alpha-D-ribose 1-methylphosphonate 5-triphosphate synthase subunit PhnG n=1 Tax=Thalassovita gelatinovora TaxID=53501 RepID=A0A0P1F9G3_THAGE|nr:phosphonate C-P lyase system protein PhnG [Thalassovita gelatinovora]QIZ81161.1 phosphonate C-P lyase system protein PhnG [Thalassovita gelatinovora]CUH64792.1 Alpha-D-ribose 1-methylphosphonate 5-triphosphate synthase subunit PhnG [Thalassovita gelatinovora]SEP91956.1 alpha-D-ribose 1-methylphosphonate 5-triphosphate synthase subunit PhnG [Thalassovita gelatinovora]